jgi:hypothetical protein
MLDYWNDDLQALLDSLNAIPDYKRNTKQRQARYTLIKIKFNM